MNGTKTYDSNDYGDVISNSKNEMHFVSWTSQFFQHIKIVGNTETKKGALTRKAPFYYVVNADVYAFIFSVS